MAYFWDRARRAAERADLFDSRLVENTPRTEPEPERFTPVPARPLTYSKLNPRTLENTSGEISIIDITYQGGMRETFPGWTANYMNERWMAFASSTVVPPPRPARRFWLHGSADRNNPSFASEEEMKNLIKEVLGPGRKLEDAAKEMGYTPFWFVVDSTGRPLMKSHKWIPATEEEIAIALDPASVSEPIESEKVACVDVTFKNGTKINFPGDEVNCDNDAWVALMYPTVVPPPRIPKRFWLHKAADRSNPQFLNDDKLREYASKAIGGAGKKLEDAATALGFEEHWFIVDAKGTPIVLEGKLVPATEEEIANAKNPLTRL